MNKTEYNKNNNDKTKFFVWVNIGSVDGESLRLNDLSIFNENIIR